VAVTALVRRRSGNDPVCQDTTQETPNMIPSTTILTLSHLEMSRRNELGRLARPHPVGGQTRVRLAILLASLTISLLLLGMPRPAAAMEPDGFGDAHGTYRLDDGTVITLFGAHPMLEVDSEQVHLRTAGTDRYEAMSGSRDVLALVRDSSGTVAAVEFIREGERPQVAARAEITMESPVTFASESAELSGSLLMPQGDGPFPAVAIVHGAEYGTRETYRLLASHLARHGVAALIYDKRGTGDSTGDFFWATFDDLTDDALAAVSLLRGQPEIDAARVGLAGLSQGGWIIASAAIRSSDVAFLIPISASGFTPAEQAAWLTGSMLAVRGFDQADIDRSARAWAMMYSTRDLIDAGFMDPMPHLPGFWFHALDPDLSAARLWERVPQPVLGLWGELDCQVPAHDSLAVLRDALERGPNERYSLRIYAGADHGMALVGPCEREIGFTHADRHAYPDGYLAAPAEWIHSLATDRPAPEIIVPAARTDTPLGWHQSTDTQPRWDGSFAIQVGVLVLLVGGFGALSIGSLVRLAWLRLVRKARVGSPTVLMTITVSAAFVATLAGALVLVETLSLADLWSRPMLDGPTVSGTSLLGRVAGMAAALTLILAAVTLIASRRARSGRRPGAHAAVVTLLVGLFGYWSTYWGFIAIPGGA
jgi:dienelactone hydrolase